MSETTHRPPPLRAPAVYRLRDLAVAPENMRFAEQPDADLPQLAATILAAGVLQPLTVRPGRRGEKPAMVLDGRRRLLAMQALRGAGEIDDDYLVSAFEEIDAGRQAAAVLLTNTAVPVHVADVVASIGKMLKAKLTPALVAGALGYSELEVRRLAALAGLHPKALEALKAGRITLRQARLLARLRDRKAQGEMAEAALDGFGFQEWRVTERLDASQVTASDSRFALVGPARYAAAGGRTEGDLFAERADVLLDPEILDNLWTARVAGIASALSTAGFDVRISSAAEPLDDETLERFGYGYGLGLDAEALEAWRQAQAAAREAAAALEGCDLTDAANDRLVTAYLAAKVAADQASEPGRPITLLQVIASGRAALDIQAYGAVVEADADAGEDDDGADDGEAARLARAAAQARRPLAETQQPLLQGVGHALHQVRTDIATRALVRALADDPTAAIIVLTARLFEVMVLEAGRARGEGALALKAEAYSGRPRPVNDALDGEVRRRLANRRAVWEASDQTAIAWVAELAPEVRLAMLAELVALALDLREERTTGLRRRARAEAAEIAALCDVDVRRWWTPDEAFLRAHSKLHLLEMLAEMGAADPAAAGRRKDELVTLVAERAAERRWAPPSLSWKVAAPIREARAEAEAADPPDEPDAGPGDPQELAA